MACNWIDSLNQIVNNHERAIELQMNKSVSSLQSLGISLSGDQICYFFDNLSNRMVETCKKVQMTFLSSMNAANIRKRQVHEQNKVIIDGLTRYGGVGQPNLKFIKVNVDCWDHVFDFLSLRDVIAMSQTCQRMRQICGHYFRENFHGTECFADPTKSFLAIQDLEVYLERDDFFCFIDTISLNTMEYVQDYSNLWGWRSLTTLELWAGGALSEIKVWTFGNVVMNLETIKIRSMSVLDHSFGEFLAACPKLKCLRFHLVDFTQEARDSVFQRVYPRLTDFQFINNDETVPISLITTFLQKNSSVKNLQIRYRDLWRIQFRTRSIQLDRLTICIGIGEKIDAIRLANELKSLHANSCYKTLYMLNEYGIMDEDDYELFINEIISCSALEVLYTNICNVFPKAMIHFAQIKELHLYRVSNNIDLEDLEAAAINLINLERLWIKCTVDQFLPFPQYSKKLKMAIFIDETGADNALDLPNMNEVRKIGGMRRKVQIGVEEMLYLATKWKAKKAVYDLVEITRLEKIREKFNHYDYIY